MNGFFISWPVAYNDFCLHGFDYLERHWKSQPRSEELLKEQDCVIIVTDHSDYDWEFIARHAKLIFGTRNATGEIQNKYKNIHLL